jgi:hypothetical protein
LTRTHRILIGVVVAGAVVIAAIGFAGSYAAVRTLALHKGFGWFANVFPIGVDAGIVVLLALDLLLTWLRIPFPLLRQTAWLLTAATIAFNGAAAWPDPLGVGMHAIIPVLFVVSVEAARHAIGRIADITADKHMESVRITRWVLAPLPTFRLWRRMKLWELRSYEEVIRREQDRLVYRARLRARYGVAWRRRAPIEAIMPLRLARYGVPLSETADAGLEAAGIEVLPLGARSAAGADAPPALTKGGSAGESAQQAQQAPTSAAATAEETAPRPAAQPAGPGADGVPDDFDLAIAQAQEYQRQMNERRAYDEQAYQQGWQGAPHDSPWFAAQRAQARAQAEAEAYAQGAVYGGPQQAYGAPQQAYGGPRPGYPQDVFGSGAFPQQVLNGQTANGHQAGAANGPGGTGGPRGSGGPDGTGGPGFAPQEQQQGHDQEHQAVRVPTGPNRTRPLGNVGMDGDLPAAPADPADSIGFDGPGGSDEANGFSIPGPHAEEPDRGPLAAEAGPEQQAPPVAEPEPEAELMTYPSGTLRLPDDVPLADAYFAAYRQYVRERGTFPNTRQLARLLEETYGGTAPEERELVAAHRELRYRFTSEAETEYIP